MATQPAPRPLARRPRTDGFTLFEVLIALAIIVVIAALGIPALQQMLARAKVQGSAREISIQLGSARLAAMRLGRNVVVRPDYDRANLLTFVDDDEDLAWDDGEDELATLPVPGAGGSLGVWLMGPDGVPGETADPAQSVDGLTPVPGEAVRVAVFEPDGSIRHAGGFRISDGKDPSNIFEIRIDPPATARVELLKFTYDVVDGLNPLADPAGSWFPQGGNNWEWY